MASAPSKKDNFLIECVKERLEATGLCQLSGDELTGKISTVFVLLQEGSEHYYVKHVDILCNRKIPLDGLNLVRLWKDDAEKVVTAFHHLWEDLPLQLRPDLTCSLKEYIACKKNYGSAQEKYTRAHMEVTRSLLDLRKHDPDKIRVMIMKLLAVTYWLFRFYCEKEIRHKESSNKSLHHFLSDLIVTFLLVECLLPPTADDAPISHGLPDFPSLKENFIHLAISPEDAVFQRLVLKQMLEILEVKCPTPQTPLCLAQSAYEEFRRRGDWLWGKEHVGGVLRIIKDQSRYMSLSSPDLRRNYVAHKTKCEVSQATKEIERINILQILKNREHEEALVTFQGIMNRVDGCDDGSYLPTPPKKLTKALNTLHHFILWDVGKEILGEDCPKVADDSVRFILEGIGFIQFVQKLARNVIKVVVGARAAATAADKTAANKVLAKIAVSLQRIIAARWYLCEVKDEGSHIAVKPAKTLFHQEVVFLPLSISSSSPILASKESQCIWCPKTLPNYAKQMRFNLHLHILDQTNM